MTIFKKVVLGVAAAAIIAPHTAWAVGSSATRARHVGGPIKLEAVYTGAHPCWYVARASVGAPPGAFYGNDLPYTVQIGSRHGACNGNGVLRSRRNVGTRGSSTVRIFFVGPAGSILKVERVGVPGT